MRENMMAPTEANVLQITNMGFNRQQAFNALTQSNNNLENAINFVINEEAQGGAQGGGQTGVASQTMDDKNIQKAIEKSLADASAYEGGNEKQVTSDDAELSKVIEMSIRDNKDAIQYMLEPTNPELKRRHEGIPVGLKNIGNTCYFNSLIQMYFMMPKFVDTIMSFENPQEETKTGPRKDGIVEDQKDLRRERCIDLVIQLQKVFGFLIRSNRKYIDPTSLAKAIVDDNGKAIEMGEQKDVGEFNMMLLTNLEEGLQCQGIPPFQRAPNPGEDLNLDNQLSRSITERMSGNPCDLEQEGVRGIKRDFFGMKKLFIEAQEEDSTLIHRNREEGFGQIMLNPEAKDLYSGWESNIFIDIEGYETPGGNHTTAHQEAWISQLPNVLVFQIQRVSYNKDKSCLEKIHTPMTFDTTIYPDRFLLENMETGTKILREINNLKKKIYNLESSLKKYKNYKSKINLGLVLESSKEFIKDQLNSGEEKEMIDTENMETENLKTFDPDKIGKLKFSGTDLGLVSEVLDTYHKKVLAEVEEMERQLSLLKKKVEDSNKLLCTKVYTLHAVLVHDGYAESGHYYSFIFDPEDSKWRKYSDAYITDVTEEQVFRESIGGYQNASAYCLIYMDSRLAIDSSKDMKNSMAPMGVVRSFSVIDTTSPNKDQLSKTQSEVSPMEDVGEKGTKFIDLYTALIKPTLLEQIDADNMELLIEIQEYQAGIMVKEIMRKYTERYKQIREFKKEIHLRLFNFTCFLSTTYEQLAKWQLLDCTLKELHPGAIGLLELDKSDPVYKKLGEALMGNEDTPKELEILDNSKRELRLQITAYKKLIFDAILVTSFIKYLLEDNFKQAFMTATFHITNIQYKYNNLYQKNARDLSRTLLFRLCTYVNELCMKMDFQPVFVHLTLINLICCETLSKNDVHTKYAHMLLQTTFTDMKDKFDAQAVEHFTNILENIKNGLRQQTKNNLPTDVQMELNEIENSDMTNTWREGWKEGQLAHKFATLFSKVQIHLKPWVKWHVKVSGKEQLNIDYFREGEHELGIDYFKPILLTNKEEVSATQEIKLEEEESKEIKAEIISPEGKQEIKEEEDEEEEMVDNTIPEEAVQNTPNSPANK